jgi:uncharacterized membrane protein YjjP (DUF1212 family)
VETINKSPLEQEVLREVIDLSLSAGQLLLQHGAPSQIVEETVHRLGTGLGADWMDVVVLTGAVVVTVNSGIEFRTKARRVVSIGVNMQVIDEINALSRNVWIHQWDRETVRAVLQRIGKARRNYNRWLTIGLVGLACASFSQLFGGGGAEFAVTLIASSTAMFVRQELAHRYFNSFLIVIVTAFVAGFIASAAALFTTRPEDALAAAVLLVVPGVPLINAAEDLIEGHLTMGIVRGINGALVSLALALGLLMAITLTGVGL